MLHIEPKPLTNDEIKTIRKHKIRSKGYVSDIQKLKNEWDYEYNKDLKPEEVGIHLDEKVVWKCINGHRFKSSIESRTRKHGTNCPVCAGLFVLPGFNDLATKKPELLKYWDYDKNIKKPNEVSPCGTDIINWKCENGHTYEMNLNKRATQNCPYCSNRKLWKGFNDFASCYPEIAKSWNYKKNDKKPDEVFKNGKYNAWLKCEKGHDFQIKLIKIRSQKKICPICNGSKIIKGINDLESLYPNLMLEWDYDKNSKLPSEIFYKRDEKFWWKCENGHEFQISPYSRTCKFRGCPICCESKGEKLIRKFLENNNLNFKAQYWFEDLKDENPLRFDFAVFNKHNELIHLIEFDGEQHFKPIDYSGKNPERAENEFKLLQKHDQMKLDYCSKHNISLLRIKFDQLKEVNDILTKIFKTHMNETILAGNGQKMTIIDYKKYEDITVQFEDGTIVEHVRYGDFKLGNIANPKFSTRAHLHAKERIGESRIANNGHTMTIIAYRNCHDIDIKFDNDEIVKHAGYNNFTRGKIGLPNTKKK